MTDNPADSKTTPEGESVKQEPPASKGLIKLAVEVGPLVVFFWANANHGIFWATGAFMVAIAISLAVNFAIEKRIPTLPLVTGVVVLIFGTLTLVLHDDTFIKMKPTIVNSLFALVLFGGMAFDKVFLKSLFGEVFHLTDEGWKILNMRWAAFFLVLAILNEAVWRTTSTDTWVSFKVFGIMPLTVLFSLAQLPLINRHQALDSNN